MEEYRRFCEESGCVSYNLIQRLESIEKPNEEQLRELGVARVLCQQSCERTAHQLYEWLKENRSL